MSIASPGNNSNHYKKDKSIEELQSYGLYEDYMTHAEVVKKLSDLREYIRCKAMMEGLADLNPEFRILKLNR